LPEKTRPGFDYPIACGAAILLTLTAYANHFHNSFHFDDSHTVQNNAFIRSVDNIPLFFTTAETFSAKPANQSYRPVVTTTLALDYRLGGGLNPVAFHVTNFSLFLLQCALMLVFFRRVMDRARPDPANRWLALLAATWYAVHPANAETVNYIIGRTEILSTLGVVLALVLFSGRGAARRYHLYLIPAALGVLAKESAAMFAPLLLLFVLLFEPAAPLRDRLRAIWPSFVVCFGTVGVAIRMASSYSSGGTSRWHYLLTQPFVFLHYAISLFLPLRLSADTYWPMVEDPFEVRVLIGAGFVAAALGIAWTTSRRRETRPIAFGVLWFFVALLPTSSLVPLWEPINDHRMYFPFVGLVLAVVWSAGLAVRRRAAAYERRMAAAAVAAILAMACGTWQRNIVWRTEESLWLTRRSNLTRPRADEPTRHQIEGQSAAGGRIFLARASVHAGLFVPARQHRDPRRRTRTAARGGSPLSQGAARRSRQPDRLHPLRAVVERGGADRRSASLRGSCRGVELRGRRRQRHPEPDSVVSRFQRRRPCRCGSRRCRTQAGHADKRPVIGRSSTDYTDHTDSAGRRVSERARRSRIRRPAARRSRAR
jgi:hypothetical protein